MKTTPLLKEAVETFNNQERLTKEHGSELFENGSLNLLGFLANKARLRHNPSNLGTFVVDTILNYTNICNVLCKFCAFYELPKSKKGYDLTIEQILERVQELVDYGGTQVLMQGGVNPRYRIQDFKNIFEKIKEKFPTVEIHSLSSAEIEWIAKKEKMSFNKVFSELKKSGYMSLPGAGAEILVDRVRKKISPLRSSRDVWLNIHRSAHEEGLTSSCTMTYGFEETTMEKMEHFDVLRKLQDETTGFTAFVCWGFQPGGTELTHLKAPGGEAYLRHVALGRLMLDNIPHLQAGWVTDGPKLCQMAMNYGADDFGGVVIGEEVIAATGVHHKVGPNEAVRLIKDLGRIPAQRNTYYDILRTFPEDVEYPMPERKNESDFSIPLI
tara:strand:- start:6 stop:1154 length:1149 start_codon:yes stop_codon:yes gene_type:complete